MWKIYRDYINDGHTEPRETGKKSHDWNENRAKSEPMSKIRLLDDDKQVYFYAYMPTADLNDDEEIAFAPLDWAMANYGCTIMEYKDEKSGNWEIL